MVFKKKTFFISCKDSIDKQKLYGYFQILLQYVTPRKIGASQYGSGHSVRYYPKRLTLIDIDIHGEYNISKIR